MSRKNIDTRTRILEVTWKLMEERLGRGVRMSDIASAASISRQALYLHFSNRADLLIATTRYIDEVNGVDERLKESRNATNGVQRLMAFIEAWGAYIPQIQGVAKALLAVYDTDADAARAWDERMLAVRAGCEAAVASLAEDGALHGDWTQKSATDLLWTMLSVRNWDQLVQGCGWTAAEFVERLQGQALYTFVASEYYPSP